MRRAAGQVIETSGTALRQRLGAEELGWLEQMEDAYLRRECAVIDGAFRSGFCRAILLAMEVLEYSLGPEGEEAPINRAYLRVQKLVRELHGCSPSLRYPYVHLEYTRCQRTAYI